MVYDEIQCEDVYVEPTEDDWADYREYLASLPDWSDDEIRLLGKDRE